MSLIKNKNSKPELIVRKYLFSKGLRYLVHDKRLLGKPDIVLPKYKTVVFVNGCFWHGHEGCKLNRLPKKNLEYWQPKIEGNKARDELNFKSLKRIGWMVILVWECELSKSNQSKTLSDLFYTITNQLNVK